MCRFSPQSELRPSAALRLHVFLVEWLCLIRTVVTISVLFALRTAIRRFRIKAYRIMLHHSRLMLPFSRSLTVSNSYQTSRFQRSTHNYPAQLPKNCSLWYRSGFTHSLSTEVAFNSSVVARSEIQKLRVVSNNMRKLQLLNVYPRVIWFIMPKKHLQLMSTLSI